METKISSYQEPGIRLQLIKIKKEVIRKDGYPTSLTEIYYQIRKNRKVLCNLKWEGPARQKFNTLIQQELLQTKITYEK